MALGYGDEDRVHENYSILPKYRMSQSLNARKKTQSTTHIPQDSSFYDLEYFISLEYRYLSYAHRSRVRNILDFLGNLDSKAVLDIGGGHGFFAYQMQQTGADVQVVDYSRAAVSFGSHRYPGLRFTHLSVYELPQLGREFDVVTCFDVIEHLDDPERMLKAVHTVLKPNGKFYIATDNDDSPFKRNRWLAALSRRLRRWSQEGRDYEMIKRVERYRRSARDKDYHKSHVSHYTFEGLRDILLANGWQVIAYRTYHTYSSFLKRILTRLLGPRSGTHMVFCCHSKQRE
jgi:2-polyprenyl-3-methyl-5-hydroxy-6-metoxy-1,4-benzoquinol methylase